MSAPRPRLLSCIHNWPDCSEGDYNPKCCRFPKSCSCTVYDDQSTPPQLLEDPYSAEINAAPYPALADVWDQGYAAGRTDTAAEQPSPPHLYARNPYRVSG